METQIELKEIERIFSKPVGSSFYGLFLRRSAEICVPIKKERK